MNFGRWDAIMTDVSQEKRSSTSNKAQRLGPRRHRTRRSSLFRVNPENPQSERKLFSNSPHATTINPGRAR